MSEQIRFTVFCLESYKQFHGMTGKNVVKLFKDYNVFGYLEEFYDILHSTGHNYINNDIDIYLRARGYSETNGHN